MHCQWNHFDPDQVDNFLQLFEELCKISLNLMVPFFSMQVTSAAEIAIGIFEIL